MLRRLPSVGSLLSASLVVSLLAGCAVTPPAKEKIKITKLDDLPKHTYPVTGQVTDLVRSDEQIKALAAQVRKDTEADLATYDIADRSTQQRMQETLLAIDLIEGSEADALARIAKVRDLETKEAKKLTTGLATQALFAARREAGPDPQAYQPVFRRLFADRLAKLPWNVVQDDIQESKGRLEILSENLLIGSIQARIQPSVDKTGELSADEANSVLGIYYAIKERLPLKNDLLAVYQQQIDANKTEKPDIWTARSLALTADQKLNPVLAAVWDSGTDPAIFQKVLFVNPRETANGQDDDGNGFIDDVNGIAFDVQANRTTGLLCPLDDAAPRMPQVMKYMKGFMDLQAAVDSPEATALKKHVAELTPEDVNGFQEDLGLAGNYSHGTHVAGIMIDGNPFLRLLIARLSYDHHLVPVPRTLEWGKRDAAKCRDTVAYFRQQGVRLVNMSWGEAQQDAEDSLKRNGIGQDAAERRDIARQVFAEQKAGLYEAVKNAPDILFICAAGNADNNVEFDQDIPSSFDLPNLMVVGAVDQAGDPTSFTSFGPTVQVYANGFEVESYVPGGQRMKFSGTSMASPNVANLAGKLLALDPTLQPAQVIDLIKKGADRKTVGSASFLLLNPKRTAELAAAQRAK